MLPLLNSRQFEKMRLILESISALRRYIVEYLLRRFILFVLQLALNCYSQWKLHYHNGIKIHRVLDNIEIGGTPESNRINRIEKGAGIFIVHQRFNNSSTFFLFQFLHRHWPKMNCPLPLMQQTQNPIMLFIEIVLERANIYRMNERSQFYSPFQGKFCA